MKKIEITTSQRLAFMDVLNNHGIKESEEYVINALNEDGPLEILPNISAAKSFVDAYQELCSFDGNTENYRYRAALIKMIMFSEEHQEKKDGVVGTLVWLYNISSKANYEEAKILTIKQLARKLFIPEMEVA